MPTHSVGPPSSSHNGTARTIDVPIGIRRSVVEARSRLQRAALPAGVVERIEHPGLRSSGWSAESQPCPEYSAIDWPVYALHASFGSTKSPTASAVQTIVSVASTSDR